MSETKTAEEILKEEGFNFIMPKPFTIKNVADLMRKYANQQNQELQRQIDELVKQNEMFKRSIESWKKEELINNEHVSELQALLEEKSAENDRLFNKYTQLKDSADEMAKNLKECKDGVDVLQGEYQDGWGDTINDANKALETYKHLTNKP